MNEWHIPVSDPVTVSAVYFLILPTDNVVLYGNSLDIYATPMEFIGDFNGFAVSQGTGTPLIPMDTHTALSLGWVEMDRVVRNRPYLDETIRAAIALVA